MEQCIIYIAKLKSVSFYTSFFFRIFYSLDIVLWFFKVLRFLQIHQEIGPKILMIQKQV